MSDSVYEECQNYKSIMHLVKTKSSKTQENLFDFKKMKTHFESAKNYEHMSMYDFAIREYDKTAELIDVMLKQPESNNQIESVSSHRDMMSCGKIIKKDYSQIFGVNREYLKLIRDTSKLQMSILILKRDIKSNATKSDKLNIGGVDIKAKDNQYQKIEGVALSRINTLKPIKKRIGECIEEIKASVNIINPNHSLQFANTSMYQKMSFNDNLDSPQYIIMLYSKLVHNFQLVEMLIKNSSEYYRKKIDLYKIYIKNSSSLPGLIKEVEKMMKEKMRLTNTTKRSLHS